MARYRKNPVKQHDRHAAAGQPTPVLRIIGGKLRGRKLLYIGHLRTRPMKEAAGDIKAIGEGREPGRQVS